MIPKGSPRLSLEGFSVHRLPHDPLRGRVPQIRLKLTKHSYPAEGLEPFSPLRIPERADVFLTDVDSTLVRGIDAQFQAQLRPGTHRFPLAGRHHFLVQVAERAVVHARMSVGPSPQLPSRSPLLSRFLPPAEQKQPVTDPSVIRSLELAFSPALVLPNVVDTLFEVQALFNDRLLRSLVSPRLSFTTAQLANVVGTDRFLELLNALAGSAQRMGVVMLSHVRAEPVYRARTGRWELRLSFSGHVELASRVPIPFTDVVLPSVILPVPFASLDELLSSTPLASADLIKDRVRIDEVVNGMRSILHSFTGSFAMDAETPQVVVQTQAVDRTRIDIGAKLPHDLKVEGRLAGKVEGEQVEVQVKEIVLGFPEPSLKMAVRARIEDLGPERGGWASRLRLHLENEVEANSRVPYLEIDATTEHPTARGTSSLALQIQDLRLDQGAGKIIVEGRNIDMLPMSRRVAFDCDVSTRHAMTLEDVGLKSELRVPDGRCSGFIELGNDGLWHLGIDGRASYALRVAQNVPCIPELSIEAGELGSQLHGEAQLSTRMDADFAPTNAFAVDVRQARVGVKLAQAQVSLHDRRVTLPPDSKLRVEARQASVSSSGPGELAFDVGWDLNGQSCLLHAGGNSVPLLAPDLRQGEITVHISPEGRLWFSGERQGLYGIRYFNTLLNPAADSEHLLEILRSEEALGHVFSALELLSPELADKAALLRDVALGVRTIAERAGIRKLSHFIPRPAMARFMSLLLAGDDSLADRMAVQIKNVTEARGLDVIEVKNIVRPYLDEFGVDYEVDGIVRWLEAILRPLGQLPNPEPVELEPLALRADLRLSFESLPSAADIYARISAGTVTEEFAATLCRLAVLLTNEQLAYVMRHARPEWGRAHLQWLGFVHAVKRRVARIAQAYGGVEYAMQDMAVALFLGEAIADGSDPMQADEKAWSRTDAWPPACALGPEEVATLLKAGLALGRQGRQAQINNRMLVDLMAARPPSFTVEVLAEMGRDNPNALTGIVFAFLDQDQDHMREPVDLPALLESKLGLEVPRRRDFMAGGRRAPESFYEALSHLADAIAPRAEAYFARKSHLQVQRHAVAPAYKPKARNRAYIQAAKQAIAAADEAGLKCDFRSRTEGPRTKARALYRTAFDCCAELLERDPLAFQSPWFKDFWQRNEEALRLLSIVRNYQDDIDRVRPWLHRWSNEPSFRDEQHLLTTVIDTIIYDKRDRQKLKRDPLVRLLIDEPARTYDFTVVSCMGVITEGAQGTELEDAYARLTERYGIRVVRAPTGTAMSLEDNARSILSSIAQVEGPYGLIGYSQGCANALAAESMLRGGTPDQQRMAQRLVCRNLLFSALNGSFHGTFGSHKFLRAIIDGERFLKHYQVMFSSEAVGAFLSAVKSVLDSLVFVRVLGGVHSLTPARALDLHREMQVVEHAPTSTIRGVITEEFLPETLELTYYLLRDMAGGAEQDSQVTARDAIGSSTRVINATTRLLQRCDMGSMRQHIHHWSPLLKETEFVTTDRDRERAVYDGPKDRHVFPWIEVNARFGRIKARSRGVGVSVPQARTRELASS